MTETEGGDFKTEFTASHGAKLGRGVYSTDDFSMATKYATGLQLPGSKAVTKLVFLIIVPANQLVVTGDSQRAVIDAVEAEGDDRLHKRRKNGDWGGDK